MSLTNTPFKKNDHRWLFCNLPLPSTGVLNKFALNILISALATDAIGTAVLFSLTDGYTSDRHNITQYQRSSADLMLMFGVRIATLIALTLICICRGVPNDLWPDHLKKTNNNKQGNQPTIEMKERLLSMQDLTLGARSAQPIFENKADEEEYEQRKQSALVQKYTSLLLLFLCFTAFQAYTGIKCVLFNFPSDHFTQSAFLFGCIVVCINVEIFSVWAFLNDATDYGEGIMLPDLHHHILYKQDKVRYKCDLCRSKSKFYSYRCDECRFDACQTCHKKYIKRKMAEAKKQDDLSLLQSIPNPNSNSNSNSKSESSANASINPYQKKKKTKKRRLSLSDGGKFIYDSSLAFGNDEKNKADEKKLTTRDYFNRSMALISPFWKIISVAMGCLIINSMANLFIPNSQGKILDRIVAGNRAEFRTQVEIFVVLSILSGLFGAIRNGCFQVVGRKLSVFTRRQLFSSLITQDLAFFDDYSSGELTSRMSNDVGQMVRPITSSLYVILSSTISLFGGLIMCFVTSWRLSMLAFTTIAPVIFLTGQYARFSKRLNRSINSALGDGSASATQAFVNIQTVKAFSAERREIHKFDSSMNDALQRGILAAFANTLTFSLTNYLDLGASVLLLYFGGIGIFNDESELTIGKLITFQLYWNMINNAYKSLQNTIVQFTRAAGAAERVFTLMDSLPDIDLDSGEDPGKLTGDISLENVTFYYKSRPERPVISNLSLQIRKGEVLALVGRSGGGKSTLINLLMRFYDPTEGAIFVNGHSQSGGKDLREVNLSKYRKQIGLVAQDTQLFDNTIEDNVVYGLNEGAEYSQIVLDHACECANALEFIRDDLEDGYSTNVGERGVKLSGGQKQRIALARLFIKQPRILFLDEATSALDTESEALVQAAIDRTIWDAPIESASELDYRASAVVLVAHRLSTVVNADKIAVIDHGTVAEYGNHQELLELGGVYAKLVRRQLQKQANIIDESGETGQSGKGKVTDDIDDLFDDDEEKKEDSGEKKTKGKKKGSKK